MKKTNNFLVIVIVFLTIVIIGLIALLIFTLTTVKEKPFEKAESVDNIVNGKVLKFLDTVTSVSGDSYYNILECVDKEDEEIFSLIIQYLVANNIYTKSGDEYIFKQSDVIKYARMYTMKDNFNFITQNPNFRYDSKNKTFISTLQFGVLGMRTVLLKSSDIYEKTETTASVLYEITGTYLDVEGSIDGKYIIKIDTSNDKEYKIISITKIK